jgi:hypothetical protein
MAEILPPRGNEPVIGMVCDKENVDVVCSKMFTNID